jgi:hypothetical protein
MIQLRLEDYTVETGRLYGWDWKFIRLRLEVYTVDYKATLRLDWIIKWWLQGDLKVETGGLYGDDKEDYTV